MTIPPERPRGNDPRNAYPLLSRHAVDKLATTLRDLEDQRRRDRADVRAALARDLTRARKKAKRPSARSRRLQAINLIGTMAEQLALAKQERRRRRKLTEARVEEIARDVLAAELPQAHAVLHGQGGGT